MKLRLAQIVLIWLFFGLGFFRVLAAPLSEGPDEAAHFYAVRFVARHGRLPVNGEERREAGYKADLPPLFYLAAGLSARPLVDLDSPPFVKISRDNPRLQLLFGLENIKAWRALTTEDPYRGELFLWHWARLVALWGSLLTLAGIYRLIRQVRPADSPWLALGGMALLAFLPRYLQTSVVISYESLTGLLFVFYFWLLFRMVQQPAHGWRYLGLGMVLGLAGTARQTAWPVMPLLFGVVLWVGYRRRRPRRMILGRLALAGLGLTLTFGLWLFYTELYFNRVAEVGWLNGLLYPFLIGDGSGRTSLQIAGLISGGEIGVMAGQAGRDSIWQWAWYLFREVWALPWLFLGLWSAALAGLIRQRRNQGEWVAILAVHFVALLSLLLVRYLFSGEANTGMGQHLLFPAGAILILLLIRGLRVWLSSSRLAGILLLLAVIYLGRAVMGQAYPPPWPVQTVPLAEEGQPVARFDTISLLGYRYETDGPWLRVILQWRAEQFSAEDYEIEVTLLDEAGQPQARWLGQPLNGQYPSRAWLPGDRLRDTVWLPQAVLSAGWYAVRLRVLTPAGPVSEPLDLEAVRLEGGTVSPTGSVSPDGHRIEYTHWLPPGQSLPYEENQTIMVSAQSPPGQAIRLSLVGPEERLYEPLAQTGPLYLFRVWPRLVSGGYRLRFEPDQAQAGVETPPLIQIETEARQFQPPAPDHPLEADFAGQIALLGYDLPRQAVEAGRPLPVTLYWQSLKNMGANFIMFNHLVDAEGRQWGGEDRLAQDVYSTLLWAPGEVVVDSFVVRVDPQAPPGNYQLLVGLYLPMGEAAISLPLMQDGEMTDRTSVSIGPIEVK